MKTIKIWLFMSLLVLISCKSQASVDTSVSSSNCGMAKSNSGDYRGAIVECSQEIQRNPGFADAYVNRGTAKYLLGDYQGAISDYSEAIRLQPDSAVAYRNRAGAKMNLGDQSAITDMNEAIRLKPDWSQAYRDGRV